VVYLALNALTPAMPNGDKRVLVIFRICGVLTGGPPCQPLSGRLFGGLLIRHHDRHCHRE
jgi:hypothetical protein